MTVKTTGAEFKRYYSDEKAWPPGQYHDDSQITVDGVHSEEADLSAVADTDEIVIVCGWVFPADEGRAIELETHFKKWRRTQSVQFLTVEVPKDKAEAVIEAIKANGGKVIK